MPGWNPVNSAASGAALAGVLAALVIAVSIQIAVTASRDRRDQAMSLKAAPITLVTLMLAAYLYIVLDGVPSSPEETRVLMGFGAPAEDLARASRGYAEPAARGFALSGSVLGVGALMTLFMVVASIYDNTVDDLHGTVTEGEREARAWAREVMWFAAITIAFILLLGYRVGAGVVQQHVGTSWWILHAAALSAPAAVTFVLERLRPQPPAPLGPRARAARRSISIFLVAVAPAILTVSIITAGPNAATVFNLTLVSVVAAAYYGLGAAAMLRLIARR